MRTMCGTGLTTWLNKSTGREGNAHTVFKIALGHVKLLVSMVFLVFNCPGYV